VELFSPKVKIDTETVHAVFPVNDVWNIFYLEFDRGDDQSSSKKYSACSIFSSPYEAQVISGTMYCRSCEICSSGIDFMYDCSNTVVSYTLNNVTNMGQDFIPGPKVESCIPIAAIIPSV
jgi:hypothetical protein